MNGFYDCSYFCLFVWGRSHIPLVTRLFLVHLREGNEPEETTQITYQELLGPSVSVQQCSPKTGWVWGYRERTGEPSLGVSEDSGEVEKEKKESANRGTEKVTWGGEVGGEQTIGWEGTRGSRWDPPWSMICVLYLQAFARVTEWQSTCPRSQSSWWLCWRVPALGLCTPLW